MSITLHTGNPRTGKTYGMTKTILKCLNSGLPVWVNYKINWNGGIRKKWNWKKFRFDYIEIPASNLKYWKRLEDLYDVEKGIIGMDEAHVYINSRRWANMPEEMERKLAQHGKDGLHIVGTVQNLRRLDTVMRELIDYWYCYTVWPRVPKDPWKPHKPKLFFKWQIFMEDDMNSKRTIRLASIYFFKKKMAANYDSFAKIKIE